MSKNKTEKLFFIYTKDFLDCMRIELKSERTIQTYKQSLNSFRKYLSDIHNKKVDEITFKYVTEDVVRQFTGYVAENNSIGTRNLRLSALKSYLQYVSTKDIEIIALQLKISQIKTKKIYPKKHNWLTKEQVLLLLNQPDTTKFGIRDRFIILFLFSTGVRLAELRHLKVKDVIVNEKYPYVKVTGKGRKNRLIPISDDIFMENFNYYCKIFHADYNPEEYLFYTVLRGSKGIMSEDNIQRILNKYANMARIKDITFPKVHPHLMRHSYAAQLYRLGLSLAEIAKLLGHESINTTEIYAETDFEMTAAALKKMIGMQPVRNWDNLSEEDKIKFLGLK